MTSGTLARVTSKYNDEERSLDMSHNNNAVFKILSRDEEMDADQLMRRETDTFVVDDENHRT